MEFNPDCPFVGRRWVLWDAKRCLLGLTALDEGVQLEGREHRVRELQGQSPGSGQDGVGRLGQSPAPLDPCPPDRVGQELVDLAGSVAQWLLSICLA